MTRYAIKGSGYGKTWHTRLDCPSITTRRRQRRGNKEWGVKPITPELCELRGLHACFRCEARTIEVK